MKKKISLRKYIKMRGKLSNLDLDETFTTFDDSNLNKEIIKISKTDKDYFYKVYFVDMVKEYHEDYIITKVKLCLKSNYTNKNNFV